MRNSIICLWFALIVCFSCSASDARKFLNTGEKKFESGDFPGAIADFTKAIEVNPQYQFAYYNRGNAEMYIMNYTNAIADYNKAIELNPQDAAAYLNRGNAKYCLIECKAAITDYDKAIELNPQYAKAYNSQVPHKIIFMLMIVLFWTSTRL